MIDGVVIKRLKVIPDERGLLMEMMRDDDPFFQKFGQVFFRSFILAWSRAGTTIRSRPITSCS